MVFDLFMGSGIIAGEAHKPGCIAIGRDINPAANNAVKTALSLSDRLEIEESFKFALICSKLANYRSVFTSTAKFLFRRFFA